MCALFCLEYVKNMGLLKMIIDLYQKIYLPNHQPEDMQTALYSVSRNVTQFLVMSRSFSLCYAVSWGS